MSFRKFGGLEYNKSNNYVSSNIVNNKNLNISDHIGKLNTKIVVDSHLDLNNQSMFNVGNIFFSNGSDLQSIENNSDLLNSNNIWLGVNTFTRLTNFQEIVSPSATIALGKFDTISSKQGNLILSTNSGSGLQFSTPNSNASLISTGPDQLTCGAAFMLAPNDTSINGGLYLYSDASKTTGYTRFTQISGQLGINNNSNYGANSISLALKNPQGQLETYINIAPELIIARADLSMDNNNISGVKSIKTDGFIDTVYNTDTGNTGQVITADGNGGWSWENGGGTDGVDSITQGTGISVNSSTGAVTITNDGIISIASGTGISSATVGGLATITNDGVTSIVAGSNITISGSTGAVTISSSGGSTGTAILDTAAEQNFTGPLIFGEPGNTGNYQFTYGRVSILNTIAFENGVTAGGRIGCEFSFNKQINGETDLLTYGQGGPGGLSIYGVGNTYPLTLVANFFPDRSTICGSLTLNTGNGAALSSTGITLTCTSANVLGVDGAIAFTMGSTGNSYQIYPNPTSSTDYGLVIANTTGTDNCRITLSNDASNYSSITCNAANGLDFGGAAGQTAGNISCNSIQTYFNSYSGTTASINTNDFNFILNQKTNIYTVTGPYTSISYMNADDFLNGITIVYAILVPSSSDYIFGITFTPNALYQIYIFSDVQGQGYSDQYSGLIYTTNTNATSSGGNSGTINGYTITTTGTSMTFQVAGSPTFKVRILRYL